MMRGLRSTIALFVVLLGLGGYIYFVESERDPALEDEKEKVLSVESDDINELRIEASTGERTVLRKEDDTWSLVEPVAAEADATEVSGLTSSLASLENQRTIAEEGADLSAFGLAEPGIEVAFTAAEGLSDRLIIGDKTPTGTELYAKLDSSPRVFLISSFLDSTFDRKPFDLREKSVLKFDRNAVDSLRLVSAERDVQLTKADNKWRITSPVTGRGDYGAIEGVVGRLNTGRMTAIVTDQAEDLKAYGLDAPRLRVTVGAGSSQASIEIGADAEGETTGVYARDTSRPLVFTVDSAFFNDVNKPPADLRPKDLFEFRTFTGNRVEIVQGTTQRVFERVKGEGENATEEWKQTEPAAELDGTKLEDFLSSLSNLRVSEFADALPPGATQEISVRAVFRDGEQQEQVTFHRAGEEVYATRQDEAGAMTVSATSFDEALKALEAAAQPAAAPESP